VKQKVWEESELKRPKHRTYSSKKWSKERLHASFYDSGGVHLVFSTHTAALREILNSARIADVAKIKKTSKPKH